MKKSALLLSFLFIVCLKTQAQYGFMGQKNTISTDLYSAAFNNRYYLEYRYAYSNTLQLQSEYQYTSIPNQPSSKASINIEQHGNLPFINTGAVNGKMNYTANTVGFGFNTSSPFTGMPMPFGYYEGIAYEYTWGHVQENYTIPLYDVFYGGRHPSTDYDLLLKYTNYAHTIKAFVGKSSYLGAHLILDIGAEFGITLGKLTNDDGLLRTTLPSNFKSNQNFFYDINQFFYHRTPLSGDFDSYFNPDKGYYIRIHFIPRVKLGMVF